MSAGIIYDNGVALTATSVGNFGDVLTSQGSGSAPIFAPGGGAGSALGFAARLTATVNNVTGSGTAYTVIFDGVIRNDSSIYDNTTGIMTANNSGLWLFNSTLFIENISSLDVGLNSWFNNITQSLQYLNLGLNPFAMQNANQTFLIVNMTSLVNLAASDQISCVLQGIGNSVDDMTLIGGASVNYCYFSGIFLGT